MKCDNCNERQAAIHLTQIVDNSVTTVHLCEECAAEKGVQTGASVSKYPLADFLASLGKGAAVALPPGGEDRACPDCRATLADFRETGRLGCPQCYEVFATHLRDLLRRIHGSSQHVGEVYLTPGESEAPDQDRLLRELKEKLHRAVESENFELAAELRDRIRVLE